MILLPNSETYDIVKRYYDLWNFVFLLILVASLCKLYVI